VFAEEEQFISLYSLGKLRFVKKNHRFSEKMLKIILLKDGFANT